MLCCVGLIGGLAVGQSLGGPWTYIAPAAGFAIGLAADMKFMKGMHHHGSQQAPGILATKESPLTESDEGKVQRQVIEIGKG